MRKRILFLLILLLFATSTAFAIEGKLFENKDDKYQITYPEDWSPLGYYKSRMDAIVVAFISPDSNASVSIQSSKSNRKRVEELSKEEVKEVVEETFNDARSSSPNIKLKCYSIENFKNQKAIKITTINPPSLHLHESVDIVFVVFNNSFRYEICYGGFLPEMKQYQRLINESINSFEYMD
ncbi:PsbP-related protein [Propionispora vibrioides]|uniref:PsbP protein n=1 Tax=Propionispora vibrioides TaxID=112903 RepID=A0A1H8VT79_9FIRM|nr:PsbP-related protein [Propionispora vibrioides]SEP18632.1 PsbP protein [Propionispora vibrioides]